MKNKREIKVWDNMTFDEYTDQLFIMKLHETVDCMKVLSKKNPFLVDEDVLQSAKILLKYFTPPKIGKK